MSKKTLDEDLPIIVAFAKKISPQINEGRFFRKRI